MRHPLVLFACLGALVLLGTMLSVAERPASKLLTTEPYRTGRSVVMAPNGMVATSQPLAAQAGLDVLRAGGNAVDAAIATNAVLAVVEPMSCGVGGDLFAIVWDAKTKKLYGLNASGRSPYRATPEEFGRRKRKEVPITGPLSWSVPGCVDGWDQLSRKFGSKKLGEVLRPAIEYAEKGFPVSPVIAVSWKSSEKSLRDTPDARGTFLIDGRAPRAGDVFRNPNMAKTLRLIAKDGRDAFYKGDVARDIVAYSNKVNGLFTLKDFEEHKSTWVEPLGTTYRGYRVWELPPNGQGIAVLQMLNILEGYDLKKWGPRSADYWHVMVEAKKLVYEDRAKYYSDPEFNKLPVEQLISKSYAEGRRKLIKMDRALKKLEAGDPRLGKADTVYLTVVDKDRNCVSLIQSNYYGFGSQHVPGKLGFPLQNRGALFSLDKGHLNRLAPHKRPFNTIIPALVTRDDKPFFCFGVMGGDMQPQGQTQVLVNLIDFGMDAQEAGEAPRIEHVGSSTPRGEAPSRDGGTLLHEKGIERRVWANLVERGHRAKGVARNGGGYQGILIDPKTNMLHGGSDPRKDGCAVGY